MKLTKLFNIYVEYFKAAVCVMLGCFFICFSSSSNILRSSRSCVWAKVECFLKSMVYVTEKFTIWPFFSLYSTIISHIATEQSDHYVVYQFYSLFQSLFIIN